MRFREILSEIRSLGVYSPEEWEEYISYFEDTDELRAYFAEHPEKERDLLKRICSGIGSDPVLPDYGISLKIVAPEYLSVDTRDYMTLGIVSGSFDLLHIGHIRGMVYAKEFLIRYPDGRLCAMILSDENIRAKKGTNRPILNLNERLEMLCNVACVDYVVPLEEPNCLDALARLKPDYFFRSRTDNVQGIVLEEIELVKSMGGSVIFFPETESGDISTTKMIEDIQKRFGVCDGK